MRLALSGSAEMVRLAWRHSRAKILAALVLTLLAGAAWPLLALALKAATGAVSAHDDRTAVLAGIGIGLGAIGVLMLQHFAYFPYTEIAESAVISLEAELMALAGGSARIGHHERPQYADRIAVLQQELSQLPDGFVGLFNTISLAVSMGVTAFLLATVNPWLLLLPLAAWPPVYAGRIAQRITDSAREESAAATRQSRHLFRLATSAASAKELRVSRLQDEIAERYAQRWDEAGRVLRRAQRKAAAATAAGQAVFAAAYLASILFVLRQAVADQRPIADVVLTIILVAQLNQQVNTGLTLLRQLQRTAQGLARLRWLRELVAAEEPPPGTVPLPAVLSSGITFHDVAFAYPGTGTRVLAGVDLTLPAGSTVAVVGENGAGKSTLVKLLCRFYDATEGTITLDGVDLRDHPLDHWRQRIAAGFQDFVRFELLARQTVGVGDLPSLDDESAVRAALDRARSYDVVERLEQGLSTPLGKSYREGAELSGGQWQKLALGRAMMREHPLLLVLDEPTSALDAQAEHTLFERYAANARRVARESGAVTVLVTHRFSTVRTADLIVVVGDSGIIETGDHRSLVAAGGLYAELHALQAAAYR